MKFRMFLIATVLAAAALPASAQLSKTFEEWGKGPAQHLMTRDEARQWKDIRSDADAQAFMDAFWARRDPTPGTPQNEFQAEFELRVKTADEKFKESSVRGAMTERGKLLILLGGPSRITRRTETAAGQTGPGMVEGGTQSPATSVVTETWLFEGDRLPKFATSSKFEVVFRDDFNPGRFRLAKAPFRTNELFDRAVQQLMAPQVAATPAPKPPAQVVETSIPAPELTAPTTTFKTQSLQTAFTEFKSAKTNSYKDVYITHGEFITADGDYFVPVQLYLTKNPGAPLDQDLTFFGVVEDSSGQIVRVFEEPVRLQATKNEFFADKSVTVPPGKYKGTFGIATEGKPLAMTSTQLDLGGLAKEDASVSRLILSNNIFALPAAQRPTDPYSFGGIKVVPKGDLTFTRQDELWYFFELRNPGVDEAGAPKIQVKVDVEAKSGQKLGAPLQEAPAEPLKGVPGHFGVGSSIPLAGFTPGEYTIKLKIIDTVKKQTYNLQEKFKIVG